MAFIHTTAIEKLRHLTKRTKIVAGGTSAGKTYGILPILIDKCIQTEGLEVSVVSESFPHLRKGAMKDFEKIMRDTSRWRDEFWNTTKSMYRFSNGSYIEFFSASDDDKVRGPRRTHLYVNEANNVTWEAFFQMSIRTSDEVWLDYNPTGDFWVQEHYIGEGGKMLDHNSELLRITYKDNEALSTSIISELEKCRDRAFFDPSIDDVAELYKESNIKSSYWSSWWRCYGLGIDGTLEGLIFQNWKPTSEHAPHNATLMGYGLDFGYSNDPCAMVAMYKHNGQFYLREMIYETGLTNRDLAQRMRELGVGSADKIIADSAEPKSIEELRRLGFTGLRPAKKGRDSITNGIQLLQQKTFLVEDSSTNLIKELRGYVWEEYKENKRNVARPAPSADHLLDALRYLGMSVFNLGGGWVISKTLRAKASKHDPKNRRSA